MGMYTELHYNVALKQPVPDEVVTLLRYMLGDIEEVEEVPFHRLFATSRWDYMLRCDSYYFDADTNSTLRYDDIHGGYYLCIRCNLKNYDDEIKLFIDWVSPYVDALPGDFLGFFRYEESLEPTLIHHKED